MNVNLASWSLPDWSSVLALLITIYNAYQITRVRRQILLNLTLSSLLERLRRNSERMNECLLLILKDASIDTFDEVIAICEANVRAVRRRLGRTRARFCSPLLSAISVYRRAQNVDSARSVYNSLQGVIQEIANREEERRIRGL